MNGTYVNGNRLTTGVPDRGPERRRPQVRPRLDDLPRPRELADDSPRRRPRPVPLRLTRPGLADSRRRAGARPRSSRRRDSARSATSCSRCRSATRTAAASRPSAGLEWGKPATLLVRFQGVRAVRMRRGTPARRGASPTTGRGGARRLAQPLSLVREGARGLPRRALRRRRRPRPAARCASRTRRRSSSRRGEEADPVHSGRIVGDLPPRGRRRAAPVARRSPGGRSIGSIRASRPAAATPGAIRDGPRGRPLPRRRRRRPRRRAGLLGARGAARAGGRHRGEARAAARAPRRRARRRATPCASARAGPFPFR